MPPADPRVPTRRGSISPDQVTTPTNHSTYERITPTTTSDPQPPTPNPPHSPTTPAPSARDQANPPAPTDQPHNPTQPKAPHTAERRRSRRGSGGQGRPRQPAAPPGPAAQAGEIRTGRNKVQRRQTARQANRGQRHVPRGASTGGGGTRGGTTVALWWARRSGADRSGRVPLRHGCRWGSSHCGWLCPRPVGAVQGQSVLTRAGPAARCGLLSPLRAAAHVGPLATAGGASHGGLHYLRRAVAHGGARQPWQAALPAAGRCSRRVAACSCGCCLLLRARGPGQRRYMGGRARCGRVCSGVRLRARCGAGSTPRGGSGGFGPGAVLRSALGPRSARVGLGPDRVGLGLGLAWSGVRGPARLGLVWAWGRLRLARLGVGIRAGSGPRPKPGSGVGT